MTGRQFRLTTQTLGIEVVDGRRILVTVPAAETIIVISGPREDDARMVDVSWGDRSLAMFEQDIRDRCASVMEMHA